MRGEKRPGLLPCWPTDAEPIRRPPPLFLASQATGPRDCGAPSRPHGLPPLVTASGVMEGSRVPQAALLQPQLRFPSGAGRHLVVTPGLTSEAGPEPTHPEHTAESGPDLRVQAHGETEAHGGPGDLWAPRGGRAPDTGPVPNFSLVVLRAPGRVARLKWLRAHGDPGPARRDSSHSWALQPLPVGPVCLPRPSQDPTLLSPAPISEPTVG